MHRVPLIFAAALLTACAGSAVPPAVAPVRTGAAQALDPTAATDPRNVGTIAVLEVVMPEPGATIGEQFAGAQFAQRVGRLHMSESVHRAWSQAALADAEQLLRERGYPVRTVSAPSSDAERAEGIRFALSATVQRLALRTEGRVAPMRVEAAATVSWELLDLAGGRTVFGRQTEGQAGATDSLDTAALGAVRHSLERLLADTLFLAALRSSAAEDGDEHAAAALTRRVIGPRDTVVLRADDLNVAPAADPTVSTAVAVVALRARSGGVGTGFIISRDGLAVTHAGIIRRGETSLWARFPNGVQRRARIVRREGRFALVQIACADPCRTVDPSPDPWPADGARLVAVGAPFDDRDAFALVNATPRGGCGLFSGSVRRLELAGVTLGGEPVARMADGMVVGVMTRDGCAALLSEVLRALGVRLAAAEP